ncbi:YceI family protein [Kribbella soli]|uniref:YceI family protein n=1 Tax=Kribbella soli TaxID=1124743 RepID=A0A4R0H6X1_9ACTN|nr:YceI family protein [Kribbella soli]TCC04262.1 YceI family protein [Kribbella soli]
MSDYYVLDGELTRIGFVAAHRVGGKVHGRFTTFEGAFRVDGAASTGWLTVQLDSVDTGNPRRDAQLRQDFFGTSTYPAMTFVATTVVQTGPQRLDVTGDLTIRGATHPITIPFTLTETPNELRLQTSHTLNRHTWNANWNRLTTALIHPNVALDLAITAIHHADHEHTQSEHA